MDEVSVINNNKTQASCFQKCLIKKSPENSIDCRVYNVGSTKQSIPTLLIILTSC